MRLGATFGVNSSRKDELTARTPAPLAAVFECSAQVFSRLVCARDAWWRKNKRNLRLLDP